jgi:hypothetical protein
MAATLVAFKSAFFGIVAHVAQAFRSARAPEKQA